MNHVDTKPDWPGAFGSALALLVGAGAIWAARDFSDLGAVFPRTIGGLLVALGIVYIALTVSGRTRRADALDGSFIRRAGVAVVMLGWAFALGPLGFLASSAAGCGALLVIANHERWTLRTALIYGAATAFVVVALYLLFKTVLLVPLP